jgi:hypothetical protein
MNPERALSRESMVTFEYGEEAGSAPEWLHG